MPPTRSTNETETGVTPSSEKEWLVELFRHTESEGWQKQMPRGSTGSPLLGISPRRDCIVIPALRQKFTLSGSDANPSAAGGGRGGGRRRDGGEEEPSSNSVASQDRSFVIRRGDSILLVSRRRTRAMVLKFQTLHDCQEFSDRFVELNPPIVAPASSAREQHHGVAHEQEQQDIVSYIVRLLHSQDFLQFVHKLETLVTSTTDGAKILEALGVRDLTLEKRAIAPSETQIAG